MLPIKHIEEGPEVSVGKMPDVDCDISAASRGKLFEYLNQQYEIARVANFSVLKSRSAIKQASRALKVPFHIVNELNKLIEPTQPIADSLKKEQVQQFVKKNNLTNLVRIAQQLEGLLDHTNIHASALVIAPDGLERYTPLALDPATGLRVTQFDMRGVEEVGLVKYDYLGLSTMDMLYQCAQSAGVDISTIPKDDEKVFSFLAAGEDLFGVFQLERSLTRQVIKITKPKTINDLAAITAVIRPVCLQSKFHELYMKGSAEHAVPIINDILEETRGVLLYQEQLMSIAQRMGGLTEEEADDLREGMGKKKASIIEAYREKFIKGCIKNGHTSNDAADIYEWFEAAAGYGFNKSHATAYALVSYYCAWFRYYYPCEYFVAVLNAYIDNGTKLKEAMKRIQKSNVCKFLLPDINKSQSFFTAEDGNIRVGLACIKRVSVALADRILEERETSPFLNLRDFLDRKITGKKMCEDLIRAGCFDDLLSSRNAGISIVNMTKNAAAKIFETSEHISEDPETPEERGQMEKGLLAIFISKNPLESMHEFQNGEHLTISDLDHGHVGRMVTVVAVIADVEHKKSKSKDPKPYIVCKLVDPFEQIDGIVFQGSFQNVTEYIGVENTPMLVTGYLEIDTFGLEEEDEALALDERDIFSYGKMRITAIKPTVEPPAKIVRIRIPDDIEGPLYDALVEGTLPSMNHPLGAAVEIEYQGDIIPLKTRILLSDNDSILGLLKSKYGATLVDAVER